MSEDLKAIASRIEELWNTGDLSIADEIYSPKVVNHAPYVPNVEDLEGCKNCVSQIHTGIPDFQVKVEDLIAEDNKLVSRWVASGTHKGVFFGIPATGKKICWSGMTIYRFDSGKIVETWWNEDSLSMLQQLGVIPTE